MLSKNTLKYINSLKIKKYRQLHKTFIVEGEKSVTELFKGTLNIVSIFCIESWAKKYSAYLETVDTEINLITEEELQKISDLSTPNQVLALVSIPETHEIEQDDLSEIILALDGIRDPGNMGTILRTADWFGIKNVACSIDCVDLYNTKVIQSTMGSYARVNVNYIDLENFLFKHIGTTPVYGALLHGPLLTDKKFLKPGILIIGNESKGISADLIKFITDPIFIPPFFNAESHSYHAESLNASVANAIICYEIRKQLSENKF
jgi:TrmH family RNA methyltransferase